MCYADKILTKQTFFSNGKGGSAIEYRYVQRESDDDDTVFQPMPQYFLRKVGCSNPSREGLQILNYARHSWPFSSEGSLACHTYCDTGHPFIIVISRTSDTHTYSRAFSSGAVTTCFSDLGLSRLGFEHPIFCLRGQRSNLLV